MKSLPQTLDEFYARSLLGIDESYRQMTINAVQWITFSKRPLLIEELADAVVIDLKATPSFDPTERLFDSHNVLRVLSSLITVYTRKAKYYARDKSMIEEVRLAHFSVKEYLISNRPKPANLSQFFVTEVTADRFIAESCLLYLKGIPEPEDRYLHKPYTKFPLLHYALSYWRDNI